MCKINEDIVMPPSSNAESMLQLAMQLLTTMTSFVSRPSDCHKLATFPDPQSTDGLGMWLTYDKLNHENTCVLSSSCVVKLVYPQEEYEHLIVKCV